MADLNCTACEEIKQEVPSLVTNGLSSAMCASLQNDTGLKASSGNDDCEDLNNLNDCLVGNMETEIDRYDVCEWKPFTKKLIDNGWTTLKAMICAICGIWTNIHDLWTTIRSLCLKKSGNKIILYSNLGDHCSVTDSDTTYDLTKSGNKIVLTGSDGSRDEVTDSDTKYGLSRNGHTVTIVEGGTNTSVTIPDDDTKYHLEGSGTHTIHLKGTDGSDDTFTIPDENTWQKNTSTQDGFVTKGGDDPLKVWCTNNDGIPNWRNSPTLGGSLTLYDHDGAIGETKYWELSADRSIPNDNATQIETVTLTAGTWVVAATVGYDLNPNGARGLGISFGTAAHRKGVLVAANISTHETILAKTYIHTVSSGTTEKVFLDCYQDSGSGLNILKAPETYVNCVRIC